MLHFSRPIRRPSRHSTLRASRVSGTQWSGGDLVEAHNDLEPRIGVIVLANALGPRTVNNRRPRHQISRSPIEVKRRAPFSDRQPQVVNFRA